MSDDILLPHKKEVSQGEAANTNSNPGESCEIGPTSARKRRQEAFRVRQEAALFQKHLPLPGHPGNGDEDLFSSKIGNYSKGLPHNRLGEVDLNAYNTLIKALTTGNPEDFEFIPLGGVAKLANPQAAYTFDLAGPDSHHLGMIVPPAFSSAWIASEMAEVYWQALTRDVPFADYDTNPLTLAAASDLSGFSDFRGPKVSGAVTAGIRPVTWWGLIFPNSCGRTYPSGPQPSPSDIGPQWPAMTT